MLATCLQERPTAYERLRRVGRKNSDGVFSITYAATAAARHSNDNGLVESKNGAVIRKHMGYTHIAAPHAARIQRFYQQHFNPYLNFHRPCGQPELLTDAKGKQKRVYRHYQTPWETFQKLPQAADHLKPGQTIEALDRIAQVDSDTAAARSMQQAKRKLFASFASANTPR